MQKKINPYEGVALDWSGMKEETSVWTSDIDYWIDRMTSFQAILDETVKKKLPLKALKKVDNLQNIVFYYSHELLMDIKSKVFHHMEALQADNKAVEGPSKEFISTHEILRKKLEEIEKSIQSYAKEFNELESNTKVEMGIQAGHIAKVMIPTDFSLNAQRATDYTLSLLGGGIKEVVLLYVLHSPFTSLGKQSIIEDETREEWEQQLETEKLRISVAYPHLNKKIKSRFETGRLVEKVEQIVSKEKIDLLVMGTKGISGIGGKLFGSNTSNVVKNLRIPILIVPQEVPLLPPEHLMLALDLRISKKPAHFDLFRAIQKQYRSHLTILNIASPESSNRSAHDKAQEDDLLNILGLEQMDVEHVVSENIKKTINERVAKQSTDLLCVVAHEHGWLYHALGMSVTVQMVLDTHTPLLVLHI